MKDPWRSFLIEVPTEPLGLGLAFIRHARFRLRDEYLTKIRRSLAGLSDADIWERPNEASNSIGNLVLHLSGNLRQWIVSGVGGAVDERVRALEFSARDSLSKAELLNRIEATIDEAVSVLDEVADVVAKSGTDAPLQRVITPQGYSQTVFDAVFHVVEHFSQHTGQIMLLAKWRSGGGLDLYDDAELEKK